MSSLFRSRAIFRLSSGNPASARHFLSTFDGQRLLGRYPVLPYDVFRVNTSRKVALRDHAMQKAKGASEYDVVLKDGMVMPSPDDGIFHGPNGMSVLVDNENTKTKVPLFRGNGVHLYRLPKGTDLAAHSLVCLREHTDHHAIQTTVPLSLADLNARLTVLCRKHGEKMSRDEFQLRYGRSYISSA